MRRIGFGFGVGLGSLMAAGGAAMMGAVTDPFAREQHPTYRRLGGRARSKYRPHQSSREIARRKGQIERGQLKASAL